MVVQGREDAVHAGNAIVIEEKPDVNAALRRAIQSVEQDHTGHVIVPDVVLHIEGDFGLFDQAETADQGIIVAF